jgi:hypothetical protein
MTSALVVYAENRIVSVSECNDFYRDLQGRGWAVRVGMEASGHGRWFERLLLELHFEVWIGDAAVIQTKRVRTAAHPGARSSVLDGRQPSLGGTSRMNREISCLDL